jgi:hypothetical protein
MKTRSIFASVLLCALSHATLGAVPPGAHYTPLPPLIKSMPDFCQLDQRYGRLPGGGVQYCAPVAVSNILIWLDQNGFPNIVPGRDGSSRVQYRLIKTLGSDVYMRTDRNTGTSPLDTMMGLERYALDRGYTIHIEWKGWRDGGKFVHSDPTPSLAWLAEGAKGLSNMIISVGWYTYDPRKKVYERLGGHYVTVVGIDTAAKDGPLLYIHNPSFGRGPAKDAKPEVCRLTAIEEGTFGPWCEYSKHPARGYYRIEGIRMRSDAEFAILDGAIRFTLSAKPNPPVPDQDVSRATPAIYSSQKSVPSGGG